MTAVEWLIEQIKSDQNQKALSLNEWMDVIEQAKEMEYKQNMDAMQIGMELQNKENNRIGFRERNGLTSFKIELSDDEIKKRIYQNVVDIGKIKLVLEIDAMIQGAQWYREQLKSRQ